jgi:hypothetical protein
MYYRSKDTLLVGTGVINMHNALQRISSTALPQNLHSIGKNISPLVKFKVNTELPDYLTSDKYTKTIQNVIQPEQTANFAFQVNITSFMTTQMPLSYFHAV